MDEYESYSLYLKFSSLDEAKNFAQTLAISQSVDILGVEVYEDQDEDSLRVYGVRMSEGEIFEF